MSAPSIICPATRDELPALARLTARSFADDPGHRRLTVPVDVPSCRTLA